MNLKQLAENLGLSQTTVSRALNGYPEVSEATRRRVVDAAELHNYRPNARAKGLATGQAMAIGHVIPIDDKHEMVNPIFGDFLAGAGETYSSLGYEMVLSVVEPGDEATVYRTMRARGSVDGVVVSAPRVSDGRLDLLDRLKMPYVVHGRVSEHEGDYSWLDVNNRSAFQRATNFLLDLGHRRIALINGLEEMDFAWRRRRGYERAMEERGLSTEPGLMVANEMTERNGYLTASQMLSRDAPPTAFLVSSLICALGVRRAIEERGLSMNRDVSVVTHDDALSYIDNGLDVPIFTATRSSVREAGRRTARMLIDRIDNPDLPHVHQLLEAQLVVGQSTGPFTASQGLKA
ncbi:substrate-binding domain-containing protein [Pelagovum pacificum]|uniref:LacI family DNA-binding transcriptional regulator n=1 Tax=Pelagovum pacificum TaxID=2588711 RepID=A0A5C5GB52_9RHOB|nr:substrate-binding domain-containing protein [Pelagovum pacificum]QQA44850.1 substrate-binding domain-containing protein [Pelagovum pacificum]TNY32045.1 LacI family DNA-binding transcriptional regulator [Pelagovum pacificum]